MAVLVTGAAGYIGSVAVERLLAAGEEVVGLDDLSKGHRGAVMDGVRFVLGNVLDKAVLARLFSEHSIETVMHFAAFSLVGESCAQPAKYFHNNVTGAQSLLDAMREAGVDRFILSSTAAVYGNPDAVPITEEMPTRPLNPYGLSKRIIEQILDWYDRAYGLRYVSLRYFNACGASLEHGEHHEPETHLIPNVLRAARGLAANVTVFGSDYPTPDGTCVRDYIHIEDLADAHLGAMRHLRNGGHSEIVNLGNSVGTSVFEVIEAVKRITGNDFPVEIAARRPGDAAVLVASSEKARRLLGWQPNKGDIDTIVRDAYTWDLAHPHGYER